MSSRNGEQCCRLAEGCMRGEYDDMTLPPPTAFLPPPPPPTPLASVSNATREYPPPPPQHYFYFFPPPPYVCVSQRMYAWPMRFFFYCRSLHCYPPHPTPTSGKRGTTASSMAGVRVYCAAGAQPHARLGGLGHERGTAGKRHPPRSVGRFPEQVRSSGEPTVTLLIEKKRISRTCPRVLQ